MRWRRARVAIADYNCRVPRSSAPPPTILVVDDSSTVRRILTVYLAPVRATVLEATGANEAIGLLGARPVDLVIADVTMPDIDGLTMVKMLRSHTNPKLRQIPVILLTGSDVSRASGMEAGASAFLTKPVSPSELFRVIGPLLGARAPTPEAPDRS
jgi:two-component system chemotaxis response regulator CheY